MLCLELIMPTEKEEYRFVHFCRDGNIESVKTLLAKDPSLINSKYIGKLLNKI